jgi:hypothetical protein
MDKNGSGAMNTPKFLGIVFQNIPSYKGRLYGSFFSELTLCGHEG